MSITTAQIRGARGILGWSQSDLSERTGISATSIGSIENGSSTPRESSLIKIRAAFESSGIEFIGREGVKVRTGNVKTFTGKRCFWEFYEDIYQTALKHPGKILVSNVDERKFEKLLSDDQINTHTKRMKGVAGLSYNILIKHGDTFFMADGDYAVYKWQPHELFSTVPFYVYGKKLAFLLFQEEPTVIVLDYPGIADAYRLQFDAIWKASTTPSKTIKEA